MYHDIYPHNLDITYMPLATPTPDDYAIVINEAGAVLVRVLGDDIELIRISDLNEAFLSYESRFLFSLDSRKAFYITLSSDSPFTDSQTYKFISSRDLRYTKPQHLSYAASVSSCLIRWYKNTAFCSRCGAPMRHSETERAMACSSLSCKNVVYPTISPSVIVLIRDGNRALLTKYAATHSSYNRYALVAGYVETGETPEMTVMREVMEEVGLRVKNINYYKSQPWPLSGALLLGFYCDLDGSPEVSIDTSELSVADWVNREDMPDRSTDVSLTSELMEMFRTGQL